MKKKKTTWQESGLPSAEWLVRLSAQGRIKVPSADSADLQDFIRQTGLGVIATPDKTHPPENKNDDIEILAAANLYSLGICRDAAGVLRRTTALLPDYRRHLMQLLLEALSQLPDDQALVDTLARMDHLGPELLALYSDKSTSSHSPQFGPWDVEIWRAPDAVTLLSKVVERPMDFPQLLDGPNPTVCFDWLSRDQRVQNPTPAPWGETQDLHTPLAAARHPFWGALAATLDACAGDHHWQVLDLRADGLRHNHVRIGEVQPVLDELWRQALGLFPAAPLLLPQEMHWTPGEHPAWLAFSLEKMAEHGLASEVAGSWRLSDRMRRELMRDDRHMQTFEMLRRRALALVRAAGQLLMKQRGT